MGKPYILQIMDGEIAGKEYFKKGFYGLYINSTNTIPMRNSQAVPWSPQSTASRYSLVSTSASDIDTTGTGARKLIIKYIDSSGTHKSETVPLNGTTYVNMSETALAYINSIEVLECGSSKKNVGSIVAKSGINGTGSIVTGIYTAMNLQEVAIWYAGNKTLYITSIRITSAGIVKYGEVRIVNTASGIYIPKIAFHVPLGGGAYEDTTIIRVPNNHHIEVYGYNGVSTEDTSVQIEGWME